MTKLERELLSECQTIASRDGLLLSDVLGDCHKFWCGPGRSIKPRGWSARAAAAARLVAKMNALVEQGDDLILGGEDAPVIDLTAELATWAAAPVGAF
jgi:hypothetical protein